jgi:16S rRNA (adenine1518-N6/adenine1519-N6)-dimethyltransferase
MSWDFAYDSPIAIKALLQAHGLNLTKKFGQNFLLSRPAVATLAQAAAKASKVWEIGPGIGTLTKALLDRGANVTAFEIDHGFCRILREEAFADEKGFELVEGDFLKTFDEYYRTHGAPDCLCANLPYNVGSICIAKVLEAGCHAPVMEFTLQKEVADRLCAMPGTDMWGSLSVLVQADYAARPLMKIPGSCFFPPPNVDSQAILLTRLDKSQVDKADREVFLSLNRTLFAQRRKTIANNLKARFENVEQRLREAGIEPSRRAETLSVSEIAAMAKAFRQHA